MLKSVAEQHHGVAAAMLYTTGQLRSAFGLSKQQWRSYRDALPPLTRDNGRSACFTTADLLATSVIRRACTSLSVPLSVFTSVALPLFELFATSPWPKLERSSLLMDVENARVELFDNKRRVSSAVLALLIELPPLAAELRQHLLTETPDPQRDLVFPPMVAGGRR
jgi:hypothetical protein